MNGIICKQFIREKRREKKAQEFQVQVLVMCMSLLGNSLLKWSSLKSQMMWIQQTRTAEEDAKTELWKSLSASLKPQAAPQQNTVKSELSECANLFGKIVADLLLQYDPKDWSYLKKKVMDVFYDFEQQKSTDRSNYQCAPINPHQFQGNNHFRPGAFFNMLTNASTS